VHSRYERRLADAAVAGRRPEIQLRVRRFFCDSTEWHGPDAYERDLARQRDLERCGWTIFRIRESAFYVDQAAVLAELWTTLEELDIHPSGWVADEPQEPPMPAEAEATTEEPEDEPVADEPEPSVDERTDQDSTLAPYDEFDGSVPTALDTTQRELVERLRSIVAVEGPVLGHRLHTVYVRASGGQRVGPQIANALNKAITSAVRSGVLIEENVVCHARWTGCLPVMGPQWRPRLPCEPVLVQAGGFRSGRGAVRINRLAAADLVFVRPVPHSVNVGRR